MYDLASSQALYTKFFKLDLRGIGLFALFSLGVFLFGAGEGTPIAVCLPMVITGILLLFTKQKERSQSSKTVNLIGFNIFYWLQIFSWVLFFPGLFVMSFYQEIPQWLFLFYDYAYFNYWSYDIWI